MKGRQRVGRAGSASFSAAWTLATAAGALAGALATTWIGYAIWLSGGTPLLTATRFLHVPLCGATIGLCVGALQGLALRYRFPRPEPWALATAVGWAIGSLLGGFGLGLVTGALQWRLLAKKVSPGEYWLFSPAADWILASAVGWLWAGPLAAHPDVPWGAWEYPHGRPSILPGGVSASLTLALIVPRIAAASIAGILTGVVLLRLLPPPNGASRSGEPLLSAAKGGLVGWMALGLGISAWLLGVGHWWLISSPLRAEWWLAYLSALALAMAIAAAVGGRMEIVRIRQGLAWPEGHGRAVGAVVLGLTYLLCYVAFLGFLIWAAAQWV